MRLLWIGCALLLLFAARGAAQAITPERIQALEDALQAEHRRNDAQARRIEELELTLASVISTADEDRRGEHMRAEVQKLVEDLLDRRGEEIRVTGGGRRNGFTVTGQIRVASRFFGGMRISTDQSFEVEHALLQMSAQLDDRFRAKLTPASAHDGTLEIIEAFGAYAVSSWAELQVGRFLVPFDGIHSWGFPSDSFIEPFLAENSPKPFLYGPWWDEGLMLTGHIPFGGDGQHDLYYAGYVINGLDQNGLDGIHKFNIGDNNRNKTLGGRVSGTFRLDDATTLAVGLAGNRGKYDPNDRLAFWTIEGDVDFRTGPWSLYLELFHRPQEVAATVIENPAATVVAATRLTGIKIRPAVKIFDDLQFFIQADRLTVRQPPRMGGQFSVLQLDDQPFAITTIEGGFKYDLTSNIRVIFEGGVFLRDAVLGPDIPFVALSTVFTF